MLILLKKKIYIYKYKYIKCKIFNFILSKYKFNFSPSSLTIISTIECRIIRNALNINAF